LGGSSVSSGQPIPEFDPNIWQSQQEYDEYIRNFTNVGGDTNSAAIQKVAQKHPPGSNGGQCGRFVNNATKIGFGDTYRSKITKCDPSIGGPQNPPKSGDIFVMPYDWTGHTGLVEHAIPKGDGTFDLYVLDSNWGLDQKVRRHVINSSKVTGFARKPIKYA